MGTSIENLLTHRDWVRRVARALVSSEDEAREVEQEAWVRAVARPPASEGKARAWFRTVLRRIARDRWRTRTRRDAREEQAPRPSASADTADLVAEAESHRLVVNAALALPDPYREAIVLRFFHELPAAEIAERLDIPLETVRTRVKRALARLRKELDDRHDGDRRAWTALVALLLPAPAKAGMALGVKAGLAAAAASLLIATVALWPKTEEPLPKTTIAAAPIVVPEGEFESVVAPEIEPAAPPPVESPAAEETTGPSLPKPPPPPPEPDLIVSVIDPRGRPLVGATVRIHPQKSREVTMRERREASWARPVPGPLPALFTGKTDAAGRFVVEELPDRPLYVGATAEGFVSRGSIQWLPGVGTISIALRPAVALSGTVTLRSGGPVPGATVMCSSQYRAPDPQATCITEKDGRYRLAAVPRGRARLSVRLSNGLFVSTSLLDTRRIREFPIVLDLPASVRGRVVDDRTGRGVAGVEVAVRGSRHTIDGWWTSGAVVTKADGTWSIRALPAGHLVLVRARAEGYLPIERNYHPAWDILRDSETHVREIRLKRGAVVSGEVRFETGGLVPGVRLSLHGEGWPDGFHTVADRRGRFRFPTVPEGTARIVASGKNCWQRGNDVGYRSGTLPRDLRIEVPASGEVRKTVSVVRGAIVTGIVTDADGTPRPGVEAFPRPGGRVGAMTDEFGRFRLENVPTEMDVKIGSRRMGGPLGWSESFRLRPGEERSEVVVVGESLVVIAGRVRMPGTPLPDGIDLRVASVSEPNRSGSGVEHGWAGGSVVPVAADGTFRAEVLWSRSLALLATANGCDERVVSLADLKPGDVREGVEVLLLAETSITGRVVCEGGKSAAGAPIHVLPWPKDAETLGQDDYGSIRAWAGETGRFTIEGLSHGRYRVTANVPGMIGASQIVSGGTDGLLLTARRARRISGILLNADTKQPAAGVTIVAGTTINSLNDPDGYRFTRSGPDGRFVLEHLLDRPYRLWIADARHHTPGDPEYLLEDRTVRDGARNLRIWLVPGRVIEGRVLGGKREPLGGIRVSSNRGQRGVSTKSDGTFRLPWLRPGKHRLRFTDQDGRGLIRVEKKGIPAGTRDVLVVMEAGPTIAGTLVDPDGNVPTGRGRLFVTPPGAERGQGVRVGADGSFRTVPLHAGRTYDLLADGYDDTIGVRVKGIAPGTEGVRVVLFPGGTISGRVLDTKGNPVGAGVFISAYRNETRRSKDPEGDRPSTRTKADGSFVLRGVGAFSFRIRAGGSGYLHVVTEAAKAVRPGARDVVLRVTRAVSLSGRLVKENGRPLACKLWRWQHDGGGKSGAGSTTRGDGRFSFDSVRPGPVQLVAEVSGVKIDLGEFTAPAKDLVITVPGH